MDSLILSDRQAELYDYCDEQEFNDVVLPEVKASVRHLIAGTNITIVEIYHPEGFVVGTIKLQAEE